MARATTAALWSVLTAAALAATAPAPARCDEGFYPAAALPAGFRSVAVARAADAVARLDTGAEDCSAAFTSRQGHLATALHCLAPGLRRAGLGRAVERSGLTWFEPRVAPGTALPFAAVVTSTGTRARAEVVLTGARLLELGPDALPALRAAGGGRPPPPSEDFAILKVEAGPAGAPCLPLSRAAPRPDLRVVAIGFPGPARRAAGVGSPGDALRASVGAVRARLSDYAELRQAELSRPELAWIERLLLPRRVAFLADVDSAEGMSGGAVVDRSGALVGVLSMGGSDAERHAPASAIAVRALWLRAEVERRLGRAAAARIFDCR